MDISIALFCLELLRAATGVAVDATRAAAGVALARAEERAHEERAAEEAALDALVLDGLVASARTGVRCAPVLGRAAALQDPVGAPPPGALPAGPRSILFDEREPQSPGGGTAHAQAGAGGAATTPSPAPGARYRLRQYTLVPPTSFAERFTLMVPSPLPATPQPLLVVFHKFATSDEDVLENTDYVRECARRGWFLVCPLGASKKHFSSLESQLNTEAVLDWVLANPSLRIDRERVYGVGFSMGGGAALNYAARHRDPSHVVLAAVVNHTGNTSLVDTYQSDIPARFIFDFWFGDGTVGSAQPWRMARSSVIDFDPATHAVDLSSDLARNLAATPLATWRASHDTIDYLPRQNDVLDTHMRFGLGRANDPEYRYTVVPYTGHDWRMVDASEACDWLGQFTLRKPYAGRTLADVDGVYDHFLVEQETAGAFTPFDWSCAPGANVLRVENTANLLRLTVDPVAAELSTSAPLAVFTHAADGTGDELVIARWPAAPSQVLEGGVATSDWLYEPATQDLRLIAVDGAPRAWTVVP